MEKFRSLKDLLRHQIKDLKSAEEQILEALPLMQKNTSNEKLQMILKDHCLETEEHIEKLAEIESLLEKEDEEGMDEVENTERRSFLATMFGTAPVCKGMQGILDEANKLLIEEMDAPLMDATIISSAQKIEHYEIASYNSAIVLAKKVKLTAIEKLLSNILKDEQKASTMLAQLDNENIPETKTNKVKKTTPVKKIMPTIESNNQVNIKKSGKHKVADKSNKNLNS